MADWTLPTLNPRQTEFFKSREKFLFYGGAKGGGKSWSIRNKLVLNCLMYPNLKALLLRRTFPELYRNHILELQRELPKDVFKYNEQKHTFTFGNGSVLEMGSCQYEGDVYNYQGAEYERIGIDEAGQFTQFMFDNFRTNLRTIRSDVKLQMYLGSNPGGVGHGWLKRLFLDKEYEKGEDPNDYKFVPAKVYDNTVLMKNTPEYVKELETLPEDLRRAYLEGDWDVFSGQVFSEWRRDKHVVSGYPFPIEEADRVISFDWGYNDHGAAVFLAKGKDGRLFQYREIYQNRKTPDEWAEELALAAQVMSVSFINLPHDCFSRQQGHDSIAEVFKRTFQKMGISIPIRRADSLTKGARANGLALFHTWLSDAPDGDPYFQIHQSCNNTIRTLPELVYKQSGDNTSGSEDVDTDGEDHLYDAIRIAFLTFGRPKGHGGGVKMKGTERTKVYNPTISPDNTMPGIDPKEFLKKNNKRGWKYL
jgi:phage terminase large subunit